MWLLWTLLAIAYVACWIFFGMVTFRKGPLVAVLDRILLSAPMDHRRVRRTHGTRRGAHGGLT